VLLLVGIVTLIRIPCSTTISISSSRTISTFMSTVKAIAIAMAVLGAAAAATVVVDVVTARSRLTRSAFWP